MTDLTGLNNRDTYLLYAEKGKTLKVHIIHLHYGQPGWFRQGVSLDAFHARNKPTKGKGNGFWFHRLHSWEFRIEEEARERVDALVGDKYEPLPQIHHNSVWDFYTAVGWDYKSKKFLSSKPTQTNP